MEGGESPLEVLSRAATMLQENQQPTEDNKQSPNNKQTTKMKRERRCRLPEYSRKSDPKIPEVFNNGEQPSTPPSLDSLLNSQAPQNTSFQNGTTPALTPTTSTASSPGSDNGNPRPGDHPLDMSVRQRGLPPSYAQTINSPSYRSSYRRTVVNNGYSRDELPSGISMCDPIIDEHFRRSLGDDYFSLFTNNNVSKEPPRVKTPPRETTSVIELMDPTGLSVDDHFAKALGDTWLKLNKKDSEIKNTTTSDNHNMVSI